MATGLYTVLSICFKRKKERWQISEERTKIYTMSDKLKIEVFEDPKLTLKLRVERHNYLVVKTISDNYTHNAPLCPDEIKKLKQFLNENYPEL